LLGKASRLKGTKIILAISGSIAAYKAASLVRLLVKKGAEVKVIMTPSAVAFISPLTLSTLSKHTVHTQIIDGDAWNNHVELGLWADAMVVAPATANTLAKMANGLCDTVLTAVYLSAKCPVYFAPAMDRDMWLHPATVSNIEKLVSYGNSLIDAETGELASGLIGKGRMAEPETIVARLESDLAAPQDLQGQQVLITAGPTYEAIDPVRYIGNHSSGKMGVALAEECARRGAQVELVLGPSRLQVDHGQINVTRVTDGESMYAACKTVHATSDISIFAAAVADYKPAQLATEKIKKTGDTLTIELTKTRDIAATLGREKTDKQVHIGFALETKDAEKYAVEKLHKKNFDLIVLNSLRDKGAGFKGDTNKITIFDKEGGRTPYELKSKTAVATDIVNTFVHKYVKST
jgi:phosphopantothenoylcysteine decarboxylase/phosphopantothenate--cysteine ligase